MLPEYEKHTCDISPDEFKLLPQVTAYLEWLYPRKKTAEEICNSHELSHLKLTPTRLKKMISFLRKYKADQSSQAGIPIRCHHDGLLRLICTSSTGFFLSADPDKHIVQTATLCMRSLGTLQNAFQYVDRLQDEDGKALKYKLETCKRILISVIEDLQQPKQ